MKFDQPQMLNGLKVQIAQAKPRMQVSPEFARIQSPELVANTNAWMTSFFGRTEWVPDGQVYKLRNEWSGDVLVMNQATFNQALAAARTDWAAA